MSKPISSITRLILERAAQGEQNFVGYKNPAVLSCGGMYLARPRSFVPAKVFYDVLNLANPKEPIKIYTGRHRLANLLHQVLAKEALN